MKKNINLRKLSSASLAFLISASPIIRAMENDKLSVGKVSVPSQKLLRDHDYYKQELRKLEESTARIHEEVDRILAEFKRNMEEYRKHTRGTDMTVITSGQEEVEQKAREKTEQEVAAEKETAEEEATKVALSEHLQKLLNRQPRNIEILIGKKLVDSLGHQPTKEEFSIGEEYWFSSSFNKEFIVAAVYLKYELGISKESILLVKVMEGLIKEKYKPTLKDLKEKLRVDVDILDTAELSVEKQTELEDKRLLVEHLEAWIHQSSILGSDATQEQIKEGVRMGGKATQEQIKASMSASKILKEAKNKNRAITIDQLDRLEEVEAWIYLRDTLKGDMNNPEFLMMATHLYIPKIIALKKEGISKPGWEQINPFDTKQFKKQLKKSKKKRNKQTPILESSANQEQIDKIFNELDKIEEVDAWTYLRDTLEKDMNNPEFVNKAIRRYIPKIIALKRKGTSEPTWEEITTPQRKKRAYS